MSQFIHDQPETIGILLSNLGTPSAPSRSAVRRYLKEFLSDPRVVKTSRWLWWPVLNLLILNTRPKRSAAAYAKVWTDEGSPLSIISKAQASQLQIQLDSLNTGYKVELAMCYGEPSVAKTLAKLQQAGARRIVVLPLYPQYSGTTTAAIFDAVAKALKPVNWLPELRFINHYHDDVLYIEALADSVRRYWQAHGKAETLLMSFHGIPQDYFIDGDPYFCECHKTARLLAEALDLEDSEWQLSFQSRLGPKQWLQPYTDKTLATLASEGVKTVQVICPGFSADCLETLEEIAMENRDIFLEAGGGDYNYIPCLNDSPSHIAMMANLIQRHTQGWQSLPGNETLTTRKQLAENLQTKE